MAARVARCDGRGPAHAVIMIMLMQEEATTCNASSWVDCQFHAPVSRRCHYIIYTAHRGMPLAPIVTGTVCSTTGILRLVRAAAASAAAASARGDDAPRSESLVRAAAASFEVRSPAPHMRPSPVPRLAMQLSEPFHRPPPPCRCSYQPGSHSAARLAARHLLAGADAASFCWCWCCRSQCRCPALFRWPFHF